MAKLLSEVEIVYCSDRDLDADRKRLGWSTQNDSIDFEVIINPAPEKIEKLVAHGDPSTLHVFSGIRWVPTIVKGLDLVRKFDAPFGIMSEPRDDQGMAGFLRVIQSWCTEGWLRRKARFVLAIGDHGSIWFSKVGYPKDKIYPFAYFVPAPNCAKKFKRSSTFRIGFVGRVVKEKGVFELVKAIEMLGNKYSLDVVGGGNDEDELFHYCEKNNISCDFKSVVPIEEIGNFISNFDVLVLPALTKDDGWGVVVSEALMVGVPVIVSKMAGSSLVFNSPLFGCKVAPEAACIAKAIRYISNSDANRGDKREQRKNTAISLLSDKAGASYFVEIVRSIESGGQIKSPFYALTRGKG